MKNKQQGFTLIELMIVIAIIAILMAYALPAYKDYTIRAKVGEGLTLGSAAKIAVAEYYFAESTWPANNSEVGVSSGIGENVSGTAVTAGGIIVITYSGIPEVTATVRIEPADVSGSVTWNCISDIDPQYLPSSCRT